MAAHRSRLVALTGLALGLGLSVAASATQAAAPRSTDPPGTSPPPTNGLGVDCRDVVKEGELPTWAAAARIDHARYVISADGLALGVLWADPMVAGQPGPDQPSNKILWIVNRPREGSDLVVTAQPHERSAPTLAHSFEANSGPGEIYPSIIDVPEAGCWEMQLEWAGHQTALLVPYEEQA